MKTIWKRELKGYFYTAVGYVFIGVFLTVASVLFFMEILRQRSGDLPAFIGEMSYLWMLLCPVLTMRLVAEERQKRTDQLLLTSPVSLPGIVAGKYLAAVTVLLITVGTTLLFVLVVALYGRVFIQELAVNYLGFILQGCVFVALDLLISACAATPMTAAVMAFGANFLLWVMDLLENAVTVSWISRALRFLSVYSRGETFLLGQLSPAGVFWDLSLIAAFLALTVWKLNQDRGGTWKLRYGGLSTLLLLITLAALTALNIGLERLEKKNGWKADFSFNAITTQGEETREVLGSLEKPVHIYALFRRGEEDAQLMELLDRYAAASPLITWEQADPSLNPTLLSRFTTETDTVEADSLIVFCEETGRARVLGPEDYVSLSVDAETGDYTYAGWTYERSITGAIAWVTRDTIPRVVILQGHGELDGESLAAFDALLEANQYEVAYADLTEESWTPSPEDLLAFFSPLRDLSEAELEKLRTFAAQGGSFLFTCDYDDPLGSMPRYTALLRSYGFLPREGVVMANPDEPASYYNHVRMYLLPRMLSTDITMDLLASGAVTTLLPGSRAFSEAEDTDRGLILSAVLESGEGSYLKLLTKDSTSVDRAEEDPEGPFPLALEARRTTAEGYVSRAFIIGCSAAWTREEIWSMTDTRQLILRVTAFLLDQEASGLTLLPKEALRPSLAAGSIGVGSVILTALPLCVLLIALLVLVPRRNR